MTDVDAKHEPAPPKTPKTTYRWSRRVTIAVPALAAVLLLCVVGSVVLSALFGKQVSTDPATIQAVADDIASIKLLPGLKPDRAFRLRKFGLSRRPAMAWVRYVDPQSDSSLVLAQVPWPYATYYSKTAMLRENLERSLQGQGIVLANPADSVGMMFIGPKDKEFTAECARGQDAKTHRIRFTFFGLFGGPHGTGMLLGSFDPERFPEAQIQRMVNSLRPAGAK